MSEIERSSAERVSAEACAQITEQMGFNLGNAVECLWRADGQSDGFALLQQARSYIDREMKRRERLS